MYEAHAQDARYEGQEVSLTIQARHCNMTNTPGVSTNQTDARVKDMGNTCQTVIARWGLVVTINLWYSNLLSGD